MKRVCVVGLGYVGLPLADLCFKKGYDVYGLEVAGHKVSAIRESHPHIKLNEANSLSADVVLICVPTPVDENNYPDMHYIKDAVNKIVTELGSNKPLIVLESTVNPFVSRKIMLPIFEEKGFVVGRDFYLAHCPERIDPGNLQWPLEKVPRVVGTITKEGLDVASEFYRNILEAEVYPMESIEAAEMVKIYENSFRAVNIAFANEMAIVMQNLNLDVKEVIDAVKTKPYGLDICKPGPGVGGHCIPVDPFYLISESQKRGHNPKFLRHAMEVNHYMPQYTVNLLVQALNEIGKSLRGSRIGCLGVAYKKDVNDLRGSPALDVLEKIKGMGAELLVHDPYVPEYNNASAEEVMACDAVMLLTNHTRFNSLDFSSVPVVIDSRNVLDKKKLRGVYKGIGR